MINKEPAVFLFDWFHRKKNAFRIIPFAFVLMIFLGGLVINSLKLAYFTRSTDYDKKAMNDSSGFLMAVLSLLFITIIIATIWILPRFGPNKRVILCIFFSNKKIFQIKSLVSCLVFSIDTLIFKPTIAIHTVRLNIIT